MPGSETARHLELKRLALQWAQRRGFRVAAAEVSLPGGRFRLDVAACRLGSRAADSPVTATAIFECKQARGDLLRDARSRRAIMERLEVLSARKLRLEAGLHRFYLDLRQGDALFPELEGCDFLRTGDECYLRLLAEMRRLGSRLGTQTKCDDLRESGTANLFYLVTEPGLVARHEVPAGWGQLTRTGDGLELTGQPLWREAALPRQILLLQRVALAATQASNRALGIDARPEAATQAVAPQEMGILRAVATEGTAMTSGGFTEASQRTESAASETLATEGCKDV